MRITTDQLDEPGKISDSADNFCDQFSSEMSNITRELSEHRRQLKDNDLEHAAARKASEERWQKATVSSNNRTRLWVAAFTSSAVVLVAVMHMVENHSYAVASQQMAETTRQQLVESEGRTSAAQLVHDELLIKRTLDERDRRIDQLIIQARSAKP